MTVAALTDATRRTKEGYESCEGCESDKPPLGQRYTLANRHGNGNNGNGRQTHNPACHREGNTTQPTQPKAKKPSLQWREAVAGATAAACSRTALAPVERVKLILQLPQQQPQTSRELPPATAWQAARKVYTQEGFWSFWRGNGPSVLRTAGAAAVNFTCLDYYKGALVKPLLQEYYTARARKGTRTTRSKRESPPLWLSSLMAAGMAGATSTTLFYPLEFARTRLALDHARHFRNTGHVVVEIVARDGVAGLYQGFGVALLGGIFYRLLHLGGYDAVKQQILFHKSEGVDLNETPPPWMWWERLAVAQSISLTAGILAYPLDSIRRRMMMQAGVPRDERLYRNAWHCVRHTLRTEGWPSFFRGVGPNVVRSIGGALLLVAYDTVRPLLGAAR